jgi:hypothetical protein
MIQTKKKWAKEIQVLIKTINIGLPALFLLVSSKCYLPTSNQLINNFPAMSTSIFKVKDYYNTQHRRKNFLDPGAHIGHTNYLGGWSQEDNSLRAPRSSGIVPCITSLAYIQKPLQGAKDNNQSCLYWSRHSKSFSNSVPEPVMKNKHSF